MSHLLVLGGTGRTGMHVLNEAVRRGHRVRALVRNPNATTCRVRAARSDGTRPDRPA
jgi:putative NADH-flavin reductase